MACTQRAPLPGILAYFQKFTGLFLRHLIMTMYFNCAWTHCAAKVSDTYDWTPHQRGHARDLHQAAVVAPGDGSETGDTTPCPLDGDALWQPCRVDEQGVPAGRAGL